MKKLILSLMILTSVNVFAATKSADDYVNLSQLFELMQSTARDHASIEGFDYNEDFYLKDLKKCKLVSAERAVGVVLDVMNEVLMNGRDEDGYMEEFYYREISELRELLSGDKYYSCTLSETDRHSLTVTHALIGLNNGYRLSLSVGYED